MKTSLTGRDVIEDSLLIMLSSHGGLPAGTAMSQYTQGISLYLTSAQYRSQSRPCLRLHACSSRKSRCTVVAPAKHVLRSVKLHQSITRPCHINL